MKLENQNILIVSNETWGDIWYSKHNWANELSSKNKVYFLNPPMKWKFANIFHTSIKTLNYTDNLTIVNYNNILPLTRFEFIYSINDFLITLLLKKWFSVNNIKNYIFWTFDPYRFSNPKLLKPKFSIYFIADKYNIKREFKLIRNIDYFFTISSVLTERLNVKKPLVLSHGISKTEFTTDSTIEISEEFILYIGNIDYRLDYTFIKKLLEKFPNEIFLFIGKINPIDNPEFKEIFIDHKYKNLIYHQPIHFKKLKNYIARAKICLAPMKLEIRGNNINHHKLLQYLAHGKSVIAAVFKDYENNNIIHSYRNHEEGIKIMVNLIAKKEQPVIIQNRINFATEYLYDNLIKKIEVYFSDNN